MKHKMLSTVTSVGFAALLAIPPPAFSATAPALGTAAGYGVSSSTYTGNGAATSVNGGNVCYTTGPGTFAPVLSGGGIVVVPCPPAVGTDQGSAVANLNGQACVSLGSTVELSGIVIGANPPGTIPPGCYSSTGAMDIAVSGSVTLSGNGVYVFRPGGALTTGATSRIVLAGACADNVFWAPSGATTLGAASTFAGNILDAAGITIGAAATLTGRALAFGGTVTADADAIAVPAPCAAPPVLVPPTIGKYFGATTIGAGGVARLVITLTNPNAAAAALTAAFTDTLPGGLAIAATPNAATTCAGSGAVSATPGGSTVTLPATRSIPGSGSCTVFVDVTGAVAGTYTNTIAAGALQTVNGSNPAPASAILVVDAALPPTPPPPPGVIPPPPTSVPTLPAWALITLLALLALAGFAGMRRPAV
jgi:hypothetical protein